MLELDELKTLHDKAYDSGTITRERASDDMVFYHVTQWDDSLLDTTMLQYRGEFNIIRKAGRQIIADLRANPVQVTFEAKADSRQDGADLIDGLYLSDDRVNTSIESYDNASGESVVCGVGAWELFTEYESNRAGNENQVIRRRPIYEANNNCFWDPNAKRLDKSDSMYCSILEAYSPDGYKALVLELTGEEPDNSVSSFSSPEQSYAFPWAAGKNELIYVVRFYHKEKVKDKVFTMIDPVGMPLTLRESDLTEIMDELIDSGFEIQDERVIERWQVTQYIASGSQILETNVIAGENVPVIPVYGERAFVEGEEHYEGITRLAKDPQRLRNFQLSYLADIVSRSPRPKPIFNAEQVQGFEFMYEENGADNNYPYVLQNRTTADGQPLPIGPIAVMPETPVPNSLMIAIQESRQAVEDVANPGLPQDITDADVSGKAVALMTNRLDQQSMVYQQNLKHAKRRDAEIYASMAVDIFDAPREVSLTLPDGTRKTEKIMDVIQDSETGEMVSLNDLTNMEFDVFADIGPSYSSKKEQTIEQLGAMAASVAATDPAMQKMLMLKQMTLMDGVQFDDMREYARKELVLGGFTEPDTDEEQAMLQQAQEARQGQQDPNMLIGQAEVMKAQVAAQKEQREQIKTAADIENQNAQTQIDVFKAQTDRQEVQIDAAVAGAELDLKRQDRFAARVSQVSNQNFRASLQ